MSWSERKPCLYDKTSTTLFDRHYIYHPAWAARILAKIRPKKHIDISSTLAFSTLISAFIPVDFYDFRPANIQLSDFEARKADLTALPFKNNSVTSLSCMHTIEHIGLGRYGDKLDPNGDLKAIKELKRVLAIGGTLLFVVPIGKPKIIFNAHRVYSLKQIKSYFSDLILKEFVLIPDKINGEYPILNPSEKFCNQQKYACGCFWFKKKK
jgi:SAM-dependent methyltransferase